MSADDPGRTWTVLELLRWTTDFFGRKGIENARLDAEVLLAHALGCKRIDLYIQFEKPVTPDERAAYRGLVQARAERKPVSLLLGEKEFWSLRFQVTPDVLTPRPETELLVALVLEVLPEKDSPARILDVGTGSGAVALAIAHERPKAQVTATDLSAEALQIARENADHLHVAERVRFLEGNLYEPVRGDRFDVVVSNPPYLVDSRAARDGLPPELSHEPEQALFAGPEGLDVLNPLIENAATVLEPGGTLALEIGFDQSQTVQAAMTKAGLVDVGVRRDLASLPRVVVARRGEG